MLQFLQVTMASKSPARQAESLAVSSSRNLPASTFLAVEVDCCVQVLAGQAAVPGAQPYDAGALTRAFLVAAFQSSVFTGWRSLPALQCWTLAPPCSMLCPFLMAQAA